LPIETKKERLRRGWKEPPQWLFYNEDGGPLDPNNLRKRYFISVWRRLGCGESASMTSETCLCCTANYDRKFKNNRVTLFRV